MTVKDHDRALVYKWFDEHAGREVAAAMMEMLPPVNWTDVATRHDLAALETRMATKDDLAALETRIESCMATKDELAALETRMASKQDLAEMQLQLQRTFVTWMLTCQVGTVAAIGVILAFVRI